MSRAKKLQREKLVAIIAKEARRLEREQNDARVDDLIFSGLGWQSNHRSHTTKHLARATIALAPLADIDELEHTAWIAIHGRAKDNGASAEAAHEIARRTLEPLGARYAACGCLAQFAGNGCCENDGAVSA